MPERRTFVQQRLALGHQIAIGRSEVQVPDLDLFDIAFRLHEVPFGFPVAASARVLS
jgi:hypothetical protein